VMRPLELVNPVTTVRKASQIVGEKEILAIAEGEKVTGILGEREIIKAMSRGVDKESSIINIASEEYLLINNPNTSLAEVAKLMAQRRVSYCIVCSEGGKPLGIITTRDVISGIS
jgi:Predicted transcriptional regulator, contains C-terminal CBS domains